jgi:GTP cyclohydrolase III
MNDIPSIMMLSDNVKNMLKIIQTHFQSNGAIIVFCEGDSLLASSEEQIEFPIELLIYGDMSFSAGIGRSTAMALLALKKAKGLGKKRVELFLDELK